MNNDKEKIKLSDLKVGDKVGLFIDYKLKSIETIQHITPKGFIKVKDILFYPDSGTARGDTSWHRFTRTIKALTEEEILDFIEENERIRIRRECLEKLDGRKFSKKFYENLLTTINLEVKKTYAKNQPMK